MVTQNPKEVRGILLLVVLLTLWSTYEAGEVATFGQMSKRARVCGPELSFMISQICASYIVEGGKSKKAFMFPPLRAFDPDVDYEAEANSVLEPSYDPYPFISKLGGVLIPSHANGKRNIVMQKRESLAKECCEKSCKITEMYGYCDGKGFFNTWSS